MKIRLEGNQLECDAAVERLRIVFEVTKVSRSYPSRHQSDTTVRVYVQVRDKPQPATPAGRQGQRAAAGSRGRAGRPSASREAPRLAGELAARFGCPPGTFDVSWLGAKQGWEVRWQDGPTRQQVRQAVADLAGPAFPAFTELLAARKLRTWRSISQRGWALHLIGLAVAGEVPDLGDSSIYWTTEEHLEAEVAFPGRPARPALQAAADELLSLASALQPEAGQGGGRVRADERDLARLLRRYGLEAIASGAARQALHADAGVVTLASRGDRHDPKRSRPQPRQGRRPP